LDETGLIQRAAEQDEQAWEALVRAHQEAVFRLAYLFTGDPDEAEDVTQETFLRAIRAIGAYDPARPFRPWILSIAANLARNRLRSVSRYLSALTRFARREPEAVMPLPPHASRPAEEAQGLWESVRQLSLPDQQILYLRYFLELSEAETAASLNVPPGTVKSRLHRALQRLRDRLNREESEAARHE
jgi:RNA polymerase sigma-70 factor, ECF subfamily